MKKQSIYDISIKQMKMFMTVAFHQSFSKAADSLFVNQSVVSRNIQGIEDALNVVLFKRKSHGVELTERGSELYHELRTFLADYEKMIHKVRSHPNWTDDTIVVGVLNLDDPEYLTRNLLKLYTKSHPGVRFDLHSYGMPDLHDMMMCGELHIGFSFKLGMGSMPNVKQSNVTRLESFFCVNKNCKGISGNTFDPKLLANETLILTSVVDFASPEERALGVCKLFGFQPKNILYVLTMEQVQIAVKNGIGFTIDGRSFKDRYPNDIMIYPIHGLKREQYLVSLHKENCSHEPTLSFLQWIKESRFLENNLR